MSHLAHLSRLDQLTLAENPCIKQPDDVEHQFDHRPHVINWCLGLRMLDGIMVGAKESLKVWWLKALRKVKLKQDDCNIYIYIFFFINISSLFF